MSKNTSAKSIVIIPSAGRGLRMQQGAGQEPCQKKNYMEIDGRPILGRTIEAFNNSAKVDAIIVVTAKEDIEYCQRDIIDKFKLEKVEAVIAGGRERQDSVGNALRFIAENYNCDIILVHDGARPLITRNIIEDVITSVKKYGSGVAAVPIKDTIKEVTGDDTVASTLPREKLRAVQTPQGFRSDIITEAAQKASEDNTTCTDESSMVERLGISVKLVAGSYENIKITTIEDIAMAEAILKARPPETK